jgi:hypothetical protein
MKILAVGDIHGEDWWKPVVFGARDLYKSYEEDKEFLQGSYKFNFENIGKIIFLGDYVDSFHVSTPDMVENLRKIVAFAKDYPDRVELLLGNHDIQYIHTENRCSGFRPEAYFDLRDIFEDNRDLFKVASSYGDYIFSHAGVTQRFWNVCEKELSHINKGLYDYTDPEKTIADHLNFLYQTKFKPLFYAGYARGGISSYPGIFWADKRELVADPLKGYSQVVGHTPQKTKDIVSLSDGHSLFFIDLMNEGAHDIFDTDATITKSFPTVRGMKY